MSIKKTNCACVILNYNDYHTTLGLVSIIQGYRSLNKIIVVDNCSTDDSAEVLSKIENDKTLFLRSPRNGGYGAGNNYGLRYAYESGEAKYGLIANPDVVFSEDVVEAMTCFLDKHEDYGAVSCVQLDRNGNQIKDIAWRIPSIADYMFMDVRRLNRFHNTRYEDIYFDNPVVDVECIPGAFLMVNLKAFFDVQGYDERMFLYGEETTLGYKFKEKGYKTALLTTMTYQHFHGVSINKSISSSTKQYELIVKSRLFFLREYLKANKIQLYLCEKIYKSIIKRRSKR